MLFRWRGCSWHPVAQAELAGLTCLFFAHPVSYFALVYRQYPWSGLLGNLGDCALCVCVQVTCLCSVETALWSKRCICLFCRVSNLVLGVLKYFALVCLCVPNCRDMAPKSGPQGVNVNTSKRNNGASEIKPNKKAKYGEAHVGLSANWENEREQKFDQINEQNFTLLWDMAKSHTSCPRKKGGGISPNLSPQIEKSQRNKFLPEKWAALPPNLNFQIEKSQRSKISPRKNRKHFPLFDDKMVKLQRSKNYCLRKWEFELELQQIKWWKKGQNFLFFWYKPLKELSQGGKRNLEKNWPNFPLFW